MATAGFRVTYATLSADDEELHAGFERGLEAARGRLGGRHGSVVAGEQRPGVETYDTVSPGDASISVGSFAVASQSDIDDAVGGCADSAARLGLAAVARAGGPARARG